MRTTPPPPQGGIDMDDRFNTTEFAKPHTKDRSARQTIKGVFDGYTEQTVIALLERRVIGELHGTISAGKEAYVYSGVADGDDGAQRHLAVKIYKTRVLSFRDRWRYVKGEHRFDEGMQAQGYDAILLWASKEYRNLHRLHRARIPCPEPISISANVMVMSMLGDKHIPYPRLAKAEVEGGDEVWTELFVQLLGLMRRMFHVCKLVHADLSEYNILYNDKTLYVIDVSQSVQHEHPNAQYFLRSDIKNMVDFFRRKRADVLPERTVYEYITSEGKSVEFEEMRNDIAELYKNRTEEPEEGGADLEVFRNLHMPQSLQEIDDGFIIDPDALRNLISGATLEDEMSDESLSEDSSDDTDGDGGAGIYEERPDKAPRGHRFEDPEAKKERKTAVKEAKREKRKTKMPKKQKKRLEGAKNRRR